VTTTSGSSALERFSLKGKIALVAGASRGIGANIAVDGGLAIAISEDWRALRVPGKD
jgi:hypothetical protein